MDRQDAVAPNTLAAPLGGPIGLASSARPSPGRMHPSPSGGNSQGYRPHTHEYRPGSQDGHHQHTPELTRDASADDDGQSIAPATPRASGFSQSQLHPSPRSSEDQSQVDPYAHGLSTRHQGPGHHVTYSYSESDEEPRYSTDAPSSGDFTTRTSGETATTTTDDRHMRETELAQRQGRDRLIQQVQLETAPQPRPLPDVQREIPIIAPIPTRDTVHGIVSQYAQRHSMVSYDSRYDDDSQASISMPTTSPTSKKTANTAQEGDGDTEEGEGEEEDAGEGT
jgi:hypothetical protein